jgi:hypothetical protein
MATGVSRMSKLLPLVQAAAPFYTQQAAWSRAERCLSFPFWLTGCALLAPALAYADDNPDSRSGRTHNIKIFAGNGNPKLANHIATLLGTRVGKARIGRFADGETDICILDKVGGSNVYLIQSTCRPANENLMELLLMAGALRRASVEHLTVVIPYYGYKRDTGGPAYNSSQSSRKLRFKDSRPMSTPISAADVALLMTTMGIDDVISIDLQPPGQVCALTVIA